MSEPDRQQTERLFSLWRQYVGDSSQPSTMDLEQAEKLIDAAIERRDRRLMPPQDLQLGEDLDRLVANWNTGWNDELRDSEFWKERKAKLNTVRQLIVEEKLAEAAEELDWLIKDSSKSVRATMLQDNIRQLHADPGDPPDKVWQRDLGRLVRWLESI